MKKRNRKKIALTISSFFLLLVTVLAVHIYVVTRPRIDASTRFMARIDLHQNIDKTDADKITAWLYQQNGVDHVLVNSQSEIAVFSFEPLKNDGNKIVQAFKTNTPYSKAERFMPSVAAMNAGCPYASSPWMTRVYHLIRSTF
jgi:hypothetical protein